MTQKKIASESVGLQISRLSLEMGLILSLGIIDMAFLSPVLNGNVGGIGMISSVIVFVIVFTGTLSQSAMSMVGKRLGAAHNLEANEIQSVALMLYTMAVIVFAILFIFFSKGLVSLLGIPDEQQAQI